eukprot:scaffold32835_cov61-Phaeocystis_antarctica.AAC.3
MRVGERTRHPTQYFTVLKACCAKKPEPCQSNVGVHHVVCAISPGIHSRGGGVDHEEDLGGVRIFTPPPEASSKASRPHCLNPPHIRPTGVATFPGPGPGLRHLFTAAPRTCTTHHPCPSSHDPQLPPSHTLAPRPRPPFSAFLHVWQEPHHERYLFRGEAARQRNERLQGGECAAGAPRRPPLATSPVNRAMCLRGEETLLISSPPWGGGTRPLSAQPTSGEP